MKDKEIKKEDLRDRIKNTREICFDLGDVLLLKYHPMENKFSIVDEEGEFSKKDVTQGDLEEFLENLNSALCFVDDLIDEKDNNN